MFVRRRVLEFLPLFAVAAVIGCGNPTGLDSVQVGPVSQSLAVGQSVQFTATGTFGNANHASSQNITGSVTWTSSIPSIATISASGLATAVTPGTTTITASTTAFNGPISSSAILTVPGSTGGGTTGGSGGGILSLTIIPSGITFGDLGESGQFLAIGTFSTAPTVRDLTNSVTWLTSAPNLFPITSNNGAGSGASPGTGTQNGGVASAYGISVGGVGATITAEATDTNGSIATATATVGCPYVAANPTATPPVAGSCNNAVLPLLSTLTFYNEGLNPGTTALGGNWLVTAPSATGTAAVLHCGPGWTGAGGSVCTATYPLLTNGVPTTVVITAPAQAGVKFGGWSSNCTNTGTITATGPNTCTISLSTVDATVAAIFN